MLKAVVMGSNFSYLRYSKPLMEVVQKILLRILLTNFLETVILSKIMERGITK